MIILYLLLGLLTSVIGALPPGASNVAVINTTVNQHINQALKIALGAGIAEIILSFIALYYNVIAATFFKTNRWLQIVVALALIFIGVFIFFRKRKNIEKKECVMRCNSKYITGFLLGLLNPPVLIYWLLVYGIINNSIAMLSISSRVYLLILFFLGVFIGKVFTLYSYGKFGVFIENKSDNINGIINRILGGLLLLVGVFQAVNIYIS